MSQTVDIKSLSHDELAGRLDAMGLPKFRLQQIEQWLWAKSVCSFDEMTNLSKDLRRSLSKQFCIAVPTITARQVSVDGTRKYLFTYPDGVSVESVGIPSRDATRLTVCFSTQAGCPMNCSFCATGKGGLVRNLTIGEMLDQIRLVGEDFGVRVSNVVAMGQGEPFLNYEAVLSALKIINDKKVGFGIGARHITVSTCGIIEGIRRFIGVKEQFTLAVSLHAAVQETRDSLMPGVKGQPLVELKAALKEYSETTGRRPTFEYAAIDGVNDDDEHIDALVEFCSGMLAHINLIPLNPVAEGDAEDGLLQPSPRIADIERILNSRGIETSIRSSRGADIDGACGQLRQKYE